MHGYSSLAVCTLVVNWTLTLLAFISIAATCATRKTRGAKAGLDDILICIALAVGTILVALSTWAIVAEGQAEHQQDLSESQLARAAKVGRLSVISRPLLLAKLWQSILVAEALWSLVTGCLRTAAGLLVFRLWKGIHSTVVPCITLTIIVMSTALATASMLEIFLVCRPFSAQWDPQVLGTCGDQLMSFTILESVGLVLDLVILALPVVLIYRLDTTMRRRVQTILLLDIGAM